MTFTFGREVSSLILTCVLEMNAAESENYLLLKSNSVTDDLFKLAIRCAEQCYTVLFISPRSIKKIPAVEKPEKDTLKRIIFMYFGDIHQLVEKLLEIHTWSLSPKLIIIDSLNEFSHTSPVDIEVEKYVLSISTLFNCVQYLERRLQQPCMSIVSFDRSQLNTNLQLLIDLYYYKTTVDSLETFASKFIP